MWPPEISIPLPQSVPTSHSKEHRFQVDLEWLLKLERGATDQSIWRWLGGAIPDGAGTDLPEENMKKNFDNVRKSVRTAP